VAKRKKDQGEILPDFGALLEPDKEPVEEPKAPKAGPAAPGPAVERPRPARTGRKVRVKAGTKKKAPAVPGEEGLPPEKEPGRIARFFTDIKGYLLSVVPEDPVEKIRFKLRILGLIKFPISFLIMGAVSILITMFLWYLAIDYDPTFMIYSRHVSVLFVLIPFCVGLFSLIYLGINLTLLNRMERRMNQQIESMLEAEEPPVKKEEGPGEEEGDESDEVHERDRKGNGSPRPAA